MSVGINISRKISCLLFYCNQNVHSLGFFLNSAQTKFWKAFLWVKTQRFSILILLNTNVNLYKVFNAIVLKTSWYSFKFDPFKNQFFLANFIFSVIPAFLFLLVYLESRLFTVWYFYSRVHSNILCSHFLMCNNNSFSSFLC